MCSHNVLTMNRQNGFGNSGVAGPGAGTSENRFTLEHATVVSRGVLNGQHSAVQRDDVLDVVGVDTCTAVTATTRLLVPAQTQVVQRPACTYRTSTLQN